MSAKEVLMAAAGAAGLPPEYVGGRVDGFAGTNVDRVVSLTSLTGGVASAPATGDVVFVYFASGSATQKSLDVSGYTLLAREYANDVNDTNFIAACKVMGATPDTSFTITGGTQNTVNAGAIAVQVWRNVNSTLPVDFASAPINTSGTFLPAPPAITPTSSNSVVIAGGGGGYSGASATYSSSDLGNFQTTSGADTYDAIVGTGSKTVSGSFTPAAFTASIGDSVDNSNVAFTLALRKSNTTQFTDPVIVGAEIRSGTGFANIPYRVPAGTLTGDLIIVASDQLPTTVSSGWTSRAIGPRVWTRLSPSNYATATNLSISATPTSSNVTSITVVLRNATFASATNATGSIAGFPISGVYGSATNIKLWVSFLAMDLQSAGTAPSYNSNFQNALLISNISSSLPTSLVAHAATAYSVLPLLSYTSFSNTSGVDACRLAFTGV